MSFSIQQRAKSAWYVNCRSFIIVQRKFKAEYGKNMLPPCAATIKKWHKLMIEKGSVARKRNSMVIAKNSEKVKTKFSENPHSSLRGASQSVGISHESVRKILKNEKWHPYKMVTVQQLFDTDYACRLKFAQNELLRISKSPSHLEFSLFQMSAMGKTKPPIFSTH